MTGATAYLPWLVAFSFNLRFVENRLNSGAVSAERADLCSPVFTSRNADRVSKRCRHATFRHRSKRAERRPQPDNGDERDDRADNRGHDDIAIAFAVLRSTNSKQRDHRAVVR